MTVNISTVQHAPENSKTKGHGPKVSVERFTRDMGSNFFIHGTYREVGTIMTFKGDLNRYMDRRGLEDMS